MRIENNTIYFYGSSEPFSNWYKCDFKIGNMTFNSVYVIIVID